MLWCIAWSSPDNTDTCAKGISFVHSCRLIRHNSKWVKNFSYNLLLCLGGCSSSFFSRLPSTIDSYLSLLTTVFYHFSIHHFTVDQDNPSLTLVNYTVHTSNKIVLLLSEKYLAYLFCNGYLQLWYYLCYPFLSYIQYLWQDKLNESPQHKAWPAEKKHDANFLAGQLLKNYRNMSVSFQFFSYEAAISSCNCDYSNHDKY